MTTTADEIRNPLFQQDIFSCILNCLAAPEEPRSALVSLARTCRAFSEPSLDRLWSKLGSLEPLIRCFATVLNEERAKMPPSPAEWAIIRRYSYRIKELEIGIFSRLSLFFLRATSLCPTLLVPNLRALKWRTSFFSEALTPLPIIFIQRLLSPSLVSLDITLSDPEDGTLQSFLANYPFLCPNIKSLTLNIERERMLPTTTEVFSQSITHYTHLERFDTSTAVDDVALMHLAMSPELKKVCLVLDPDKSNLHQVHIPPDIPPFRNAERLFLEVWDLYFATTLLRTEDQMFHSFGIRHRSEPTTDAVFTLLSALASPQRTRSLQSIRFLPNELDVERHRFTPPSPDELSTPHRLTRDTFRPLTSLCHLRQLIVDLSCWVSIDDDDLKSLVRNWPQLRTLNLDCQSRQYEPGYPWRSAKYVTLRGLLSLIECCPDLEELCLPLDAREVPVDTGNVICNPALLEILFPESPIGDPGPVEEILSQHFPSVVYVSCSFDLSSEEDPEVKSYIESWEGVKEYLRDVHETTRGGLDL